MAGLLIGRWHEITRPCSRRGVRLVPASRPSRRAAPSTMTTSAVKSLSPRISDEPDAVGVHRDARAPRTPRIRSASKPPETTIRTPLWPASSSAARTFSTSRGVDAGRLEAAHLVQSERSTRSSEVSSRTPHSSSPERVGHLQRGLDRVVLEVDQHGDVHLVGEPLGEARAAASRCRRRRRRSAPCGTVPDAAAAPPRRLGVGGHADRAGHVGGPAVARLHQPVVVAGGEVEDRLAVAPPPRPRARCASPACGAPGSRGRRSRGGRTARSRPRSSSRSRAARSRRPRAARGPSSSSQPGPLRRPSLAARALLQDRHRLVDPAEHRVAASGTPAWSRADGDPRPRAGSWCG